MIGVTDPPSTASLSVAVLMTTFNRREVTLRCLRSLDIANTQTRLRLHIYLVDASSSDGTAEAVRSEFPQIHVSSAPSDTYWAMGMRKAWEVAQGEEYDSILWLNDDVILHEDALVHMLNSAEATQHNAIIVGAFSDPDTGESTYGGNILGPAFRRFSGTPVSPNGTLQAIDSANGNLIWTPQMIDQRLGGFPKGFTHAMADTDFTLNARKHNIDVFLTGSAVGTCRRNPIEGTWKDRSLSAEQRLKLLSSPKGLPFREYARVCTRYGGVTGPLYAVKPHLSLYLQLAREMLAPKQA